MSEEKKEESPKCLKCKWMVEKDYGYSDYTTEGRNFFCALGQFSKVDADEDNDNYMKIIKNASRYCDLFKEGKNIHISVDENGFESEVQKKWASEFLTPK